jgi:hypothetical protein
LIQVNNLNEKGGSDRLREELVKRFIVWRISLWHALLLQPRSRRL